MAQHRTTWLKWLLISSGLLMLVAGLVVWLVLRYQPKVSLINQSTQLILTASIQLPSNHLTFDSVAPGDQLTIAYSPAQTDGVYDYRLALENGQVIKGSCGYVTNSEFGKRVELTLNSNLSVSCEEYYN